MGILNACTSPDSYPATSTDTTMMLPDTSFSIPDTTSMSYPGIAGEESEDVDSEIEEILKEVTKETLKEALKHVNEEYVRGKENSDVSQAKKDYDYFKQKMDEANVTVDENFKTQVKNAGIKINVEDILEGEHGDLPGESNSEFVGGGRSSVAITNNTRYSLTIMYSGASYQSVTILPDATETIYLSSGEYSIAASVNAYNVRNYAGQASLAKGYQYSEQYYISNGF